MACHYQRRYDCIIREGSFRSGLVHPCILEEITTSEGVKHPLEMGSSKVLTASAMGERTCQQGVWQI